MNNLPASKEITDLLDQWSKETQCDSVVSCDLEAFKVDHGDSKNLPSYLKPTLSSKKKMKNPTKNNKAEGKGRKQQNQPCQKHKADSCPKQGMERMQKGGQSNFFENLMVATFCSVILLFFVLPCLDLLSKYLTSIQVKDTELSHEMERDRIEWQR